MTDQDHEWIEALAKRIETLERHFDALEELVLKLNKVIEDGYWKLD